MKRVSKKTSRRRSARALAVALALQRDINCQGLMRVPGHRCYGPLVGHEPLKRSAGGDPCDPDEVMIVCAGLNAWIEDNPVQARAFGLSKSMSDRYENGRLVRRPYPTDPQGDEHADADHAE